MSTTTVLAAPTPPACSPIEIFSARLTNYMVAIARFAEPLALTSIFPYLPEMISSFGVAQNDVARWAGYTSGVFSLSQSMTAVAWGRTSDRIGRKPTVIIGLLSTMLFFVVWGLSTSLPMAIIVRAIMGAGNGNVGIIRTMVAEMVPEKELQPRAFSIMPLIWSVGSIFGPAFGGFFANPARRFPALFAHSWFFNAYPFALPNLIAALVFLVSVTTATLFLKETLESKRHKPDWGLLLGQRLTRPFRPSRPRRSHQPTGPMLTSFIADETPVPVVPTQPDPPAQPLRRGSHSDEAPSLKAVFTFQTATNLLCYTFLALHSVAFDQLLPVFLNYPRQFHTPDNTSLPFRFSGGFGLTSDRIGTIFTIYGITCGVIQFFLFPPLCNRFGVLRCYRTCAVTFPVVYLFTPYVVLFESSTARYAALVIVMFVKAFAVIIGFPCITILLTNSAPSLRILGTLNGFATMFSGLGRAFGPATAGAIFSWGVARGYLIPAYWFLALTALLGAIPVYMLFDHDALTQAPDTSDDENERLGDESHINDHSPIASGSRQGASAETTPLLGAKNETAGYDTVSRSRH